ncbi:MAG: RNA 2',3'-cyclic phosphodiesterase [Chloroflexi bacterium]|nr:RNA 2',3'-cyclic phosphodiesterase [Chloroflexota bacterium]
MMAERLIRCFIAIELPSPIVQAVDEVLRTLVDRANALALGREVRWVRPEGVHLTLRFLGEVPERQIERIDHAIATALGGQVGCSIALGPLGVFPRATATRVIRVGVSGDLAPLQGYQRQIEQALEPLGYRPEPRAFSPHLTLGRVRETTAPEQRRALADLTTLVRPSSLSWRVEEISLMRSELSREGARYTRLSVVRLRP